MKYPGRSLFVLVFALSLYGQNQVLLLDGDGDFVQLFVHEVGEVPIQNFLLPSRDSLVKAFVDAGVQVDFFPYPMHEHNVRGKDRIHLMRKVLDYIDNNLKE